MSGPPVIFCVDLVVLRSAIEVLEMRTMLHLNSQALSSRAWMTTDVDAFVLFYIGRCHPVKQGRGCSPSPWTGSPPNTSDTERTPTSLVQAEHFRSEEANACASGWSRGLDLSWGDSLVSSAGSDEGGAHDDADGVVSAPELRLSSPTFWVFAGVQDSSPVGGPLEGLGTPDSEPG